MKELPNGKSDLIGDESITCNEDEVDDAETRDNLTAEEEIQDVTEISYINCNANTNGPVNANTSLRDAILDEQVRKVTSTRSRGKLSTVASVTSCDSSPVKKSTSYVLATSPVVLGSIMTKEDSPAKGRERDEKIRILRERKMEEQRKKEEELKESIARAEEVRKRQEDERKKRMEEQRRREEEHRALVEERRRRLWDEEFERRQAIIKRTAEREARIDFKKPYKSALGLSKSCGHSDGTLSSGTARTHVRSLLSPSSLSRQSPTTAASVAADEGNADNSNKASRGRMHKSRETARRSAPLSNDHYERPRSLAPNYCSATVSFRIRAGQGADAGTSNGEWNSCICPRFRSTSPSKNRARSMGNIQRSKMDATNGATNLKSSGPLGPSRDKGFVVTAKSTTKPREKTPARVRHSVTPAPVSTNQQQEAFDRLRSRRSKTPVVIRNGEELKKTNEECIKQAISNRGGLMVKSMENSSSLQSKNLKKMKSSWAPAVQKEKEKQEKPKQHAVKAIPRKSTVGPQKPTTLPEKIGENGGSPVNEIQQNATSDHITSNKGEDNETNKDIPSNNATSTPTSEVAIGIAKKLSQVEEHQRKLAENRRLARERAEQKAEEERIRLEKLRIEEEERQKREEEEAKRQEEEELRLLEEAKRIEHERYLKAVEEEAERRRLEEERAEAERKEKLEAELRAQEEAERKEKERIEKMKKMAEEKEERKKKLEMIMKRVKADEPISKIDPVRSPTIEDTSNSLSLTTNVTSQPPSINSDAFKHLPGLQDTVPRNDADTSSFKSPLLQKMLGSKIKGVSKSHTVSVANADETSKPIDVVALAESKSESSDDVCHLEEGSKQTIDLNNKVPTPRKEVSARKSPVQFQTSLVADSHEKESGARLSPDHDDIPSEDSKLEEKETAKLLEVDGHTTPVESLGSVSNDVHDAVNCLIDAIENGNLGLAVVECGDQLGIQNKSNSAESNHKVDEILDSIVCEEDVKCMLADSLEDDILVHEASSSPSIPLVGEELPTLAVRDHLIGPPIFPSSLDLNSSILSQSNKPLPPKETSLQSLLPTKEVNRHEKIGHCKSSCINSDAEEEDDCSNDDSENSQEFSVRPLKISNVAKELGGQEEGLLKFDEEISSKTAKNKEDSKKKSFDNERETMADPFGNWSTGLDRTNILPSMFVGPHLPAETAGTGDGLQKNFGITSTISE